MWGLSLSLSLCLINMEMYKSFIKDFMTGTLFLDIEGVYDNVIPQISFNDFRINGFRILKDYKKFFFNLLCSKTVDFFNRVNFWVEEEFLKDFLRDLSWVQLCVIYTLRIVFFIFFINANLCNLRTILLYLQAIIF